MAHDESSLRNAFSSAFRRVVAHSAGAAAFAENSGFPWGSTIRRLQQMRASRAAAALARELGLAIQGAPGALWDPGDDPWEMKLTRFTERHVVDR